MIRVFEFDEIPVICKKDLTIGSNSILRNGATYTRSYGKPETIEVPSQNEMRDILNLATEKKVRRFLEMSKRIGVTMPTEISDEEKFENQVKDFLADE